MAKFVDATGVEVKPEEAPSILDTSGIPKDVLSKSEIPMYGPGGAILVKKDELAKAIGSGYTYDSPQDQLKRSFDEKYIKGGVNATKTFLGSAASGATLGLSDVAGRALDEDYAEITAARREAMPGVNFAGQLTGGIATAVLGPGAALLGGARTAGKGIAQQIIKGTLGKKIAAGGLAETTAGLAGAGAAEGLLQGAGQGVSQVALTQGPIDTKEAAETILMSAGLGAVLGAPLEVAGSAGISGLKGGLKKLFKGSEEQAIKTGEILAKADAPDVNLGDELAAGAQRLKENAKQIDDAATLLGLDPETDLTAGFKSDSRLVQKLDGELAKRSTYKGRLTARMHENVYNTTKNAIDDNIFKPLKDANFAGGIDDARAMGDQAVEQLKKQIDDVYTPLSEQYENFYKGTDNVKPSVELIEANTKNWIDIDPDSKFLSEAEKYKRQLLRAKNPRDISKLRTEVGNELDKAFNARDKNAIEFYSGIKKDLTKLRSDVLSDAIFKATQDEAEGAAAVSSLKAIDTKWAQASDMLSEFMEGSKIKGGGRSGVKKALDKITAETVLNRIFKAKDSANLEFLQSNFPRAYETLKTWFLANLKESSSKKGALNVADFIKKTAPDQMSERSRKIIFGETGESIRNAAKTIQDAFPIGSNPSGSASDIDNLMGGVGAAVQAAKGGGAGIWDFAANIAYREARDYAQFAAINGMGKIEQGIIKRGKTIDQALNAFFDRPKLARGLQAGSKMAAIVPIINTRETKKTENLDYVAELANNPTKLVAQMDKNMGNLKFVAPELYEIVQERGARAVSFLESKLPKQMVGGPLDKIPKQYSDAELAKYSRYVRAIQDPNSIIEDFGNYTLMPEAVEAVREIFPEVYSKITKQVFNNLAAHKEPLTFAQKQQASVMLGFPVSSQLTPQFIQSMQKKYQAPGAENTNAPATAGQPSATGMKQFDLATKTQTGMERVLSR